MLYCCKETRNFFRANFICLFSRLWKCIMKYTKFFKLEARKFHFPTYKNFFQNGFFIVFELGNSPPEI